MFKNRLFMVSRKGRLQNSSFSISQMTVSRKNQMEIPVPTTGCLRPGTDEDQHRSSSFRYTASHRWAKASACRFQVYRSYVTLFQKVAISSLHLLAGLPCDSIPQRCAVHRSYWKRLNVFCPGPLSYHYLNDRKQFVSYINTTSLYMKVTCGVPQGSILGPLLFIVYINDIANVSNIFKTNLFADDTSLLHTRDNL